MSSRTGIALLAAVTSLLAGARSTLAAEPQPGSGRNVQITITTGNTERKDVPVRTYRMLCREDAPRARMIMGWRTPIPTARGAAEASGEAPVTTYMYQNVGMTAQFEMHMPSASAITIDGTIEISAARGIPGVEVPRDMPVIGTFQQELAVVLTPGKPLRVAEVPDPDGGTLYLQLEARVLE
jgi:hypothetical protein